MAEQDDTAVGFFGGGLFVIYFLDEVDERGNRIAHGFLGGRNRVTGVSGARDVKNIMAEAVEVSHYSV